MHPPAALGRRYLSLFYEALLLAAVVWAAAFLYSAVEQSFKLVHVRPLFQVYLASVVGIYFVTQWVRGGQTLAMKAWRLRVERHDGKALIPAQAVARYAIALTGTLALGLTFLWPLVDRDRAFLHDRLARTRIVRI